MVPELPTKPSNQGAESSSVRTLVDLIYMASPPTMFEAPHLDSHMGILSRNEPDISR